MIRVRNLEFAYAAGGFTLAVPSISVSSAESVALTGPSGCGKTTLIHLLAGILEAGAGTIEVGGIDMAALAPADRQDLRALRIGLVFQEFELLEYLDVLDNVLLPYRLTPVLELDGEVVDRAHGLIADVGLGDKCCRFPGELSQGERQRIALCRALVTEPAVVLGDEPTGNLDAGNRDHVIDSLLVYGRSKGAAVVVVTHDRELLPRFDRTVEVSTFARPQITQMESSHEEGTGSE
ncbi:MAG: ABC transporter ATP-binding protein [Thermoanaerobaculales bacterium]|nr:ABC transporter ATP-binding protein [Thermoanaerobaculales bacterium]